MNERAAKADRAGRPAGRRRYRQPCLSSHESAIARAARDKGDTSDRDVILQNPHRRAVVPTGRQTRRALTVPDYGDHPSFITEGSPLI